MLELPDENFAHEVMQLFLIGLYDHNPDGTRKKEESEIEIKPYTLLDVMEMSHCWTGIRAVHWRGNSAAQNGNRIHPMIVRHKYVPSQAT